MVGIYGVLGYTISLRTHEIGIRVAIGASRDDIFRQVMGKAMKLTTAGLLFGILGAMLTTRLLANYLFKVSATDPPVFVLAAALSLATSCWASYWPARRATRVDAMVALRHE